MDGAVVKLRIPDFVEDDPESDQEPEDADRRGGSFIRAFFQDAERCPGYGWNKREQLEPDIGQCGELLHRRLVVETQVCHRIACSVFAGRRSQRFFKCPTPSLKHRFRFLRGFSAAWRALILRVEFDEQHNSAF